MLLVTRVSTTLVILGQNQIDVVVALKGPMLFLDHAEWRLFENHISRFAAFLAIQGCL